MKFKENISNTLKEDSYKNINNNDLNNIEVTIDCQFNYKRERRALYDK